MPPRDDLRDHLRTAFSVGRAHIVAIAALGTLTFGWLLTGERPWGLAAVTALDWFLVNLLNRVVDLREDAANGIAGTDFVARHRRAILALGFAVLGASFPLLYLVFPSVTPLRLGYHALGLAYNWPLLGDGRRIKQLYFWKNTASATGFLLTVFGYPLAAAHARVLDGRAVALAAIFFFAFELSYEVIYDLRDAPGDAEAGVRTYAVVHGIAGAARVIDGLCIAAIAVLAVGYALHAVPWRLAVMAVAPAVQLAWYKRALRRGIASRDCVRMTWAGALLLAAYNAWAWAGLPGVGS